VLQERQFAQSARHSKKFLQDIGGRPWIQHFTWLGAGTYSRDAKALALNNLGAAEIFLGEFAAARAHLERSRKLDDENPLPYFNLAELELRGSVVSHRDRGRCAANRRDHIRGIERARSFAGMQSGGCWIVVRTGGSTRDPRRRALAPNVTGAPSQ
jgi:hypothetical protein